MRLFLNKGYKLHGMVLEGLVDHFFSFQESSLRPPLLWFQCLQAFVERYYLDLNEEGRGKMGEVVNTHSHKNISPLLKQLIHSIDSNT